MKDQIKIFTVKVSRTGRHDAPIEKLNEFVNQWLGVMQRTGAKIVSQSTTAIGRLFTITVHYRQNRHSNQTQPPTERKQNDCNIRNN